MMPVMDGYQLSQELKSDALTSHIPIIMLTARSDHDSKLMGLREKVDDYLTKPFSDDELTLRIVNLLSIRDTLKRRYSLQLYDESAAPEALSDHQQVFVDRLHAIVNEQISDPDFRVEQLAEKLAMSDRQLQRKLKAILDHSPAEYLRAYRLKVAIRELRKGKRIGLVAEDVGFSSPAYFASCFRAQFGMSPREFQQKNSETF
jgi:AraC-like DNA-binding protein